MSDEEPTKRFNGEDRTTPPMLETLLREFRAFRVEMTEFHAETNQRLAKLESGLEHAAGRLTVIEERLERVEIDLNKTRAIAHDTRADVREFRAQLREALPSLVK